jgi:sugar lactone lactonase YvrE
MAKNMRIILACVSCALLGAEARANVPVKIDGATSPNNSYTLEGVCADEGGCRIEIKTVTAGGKMVGRFSHGDFQVSDSRYTMSAVWNKDSSAFALNITEGRNITVSRVFAENGGAWKEAALPEKAIDRVRAKANTKDGKAQDYLDASEWMSRDKLKFTYQGNTGEQYEVICRLVGGAKPRLVFVESIAPEPEAEATPETAEPKHDYENYVFTVLAGGTPGSKDSVGAAAQFKTPRGVAVDSAGNVFVADTGNHVIRKISADGTVTTVAGLAGNSGKVDGVSAAARFWSPESLAIDPAGNLYVVDSGSDSLKADAAIRKVTPSGTVSTLADSTVLASRGPRHGDLEPEARAVGVDKNGILYVTLENDYIIRKIAPDRAVTTLAGLAGTSGMVNGPAKSARFIKPQGLAADAKDNLYVADTSAIRKVDSSGAVTTLAGSRDKSGETDGVGSAAQFVDLRAIAVDSAGNVYGIDSQNVRKITPAGVVKTLHDVRNQSPFHLPVAIAADDKGWLYVANVEDATIVVGKPAK